MNNKLKLLMITSVLSLYSVLTIAADDHPAQVLVVDSTTDLLAVLKDEVDLVKNDSAFLGEQVEKHVVPHVDFESMTKLAIGKAWRQADDRQRVALVSEFKALLLSTYTSALTSYSGESVLFEPFKPERRDDRAVVRSFFKSSTGTVPVLYKLRDKNGWLIYDIEVDRISLVASYRTAFSSEIEKGGIEGLLQTMKDKNAES